MNLKSWTKEEIENLFKTVALHKSNNKSLLQAFQDFANRYARKTLSVRNFYYAQLKVFEKQPALCKEYGVKLAQHQKSMPIFFSSVEEQNCIAEIDELLKKGYSVRRACKELSGGDVEKMLRLQNKYYSIKQKNHEVEAQKVLVMPKRNSGLSESEITSLMMGLVRLVKKSAEESAEKMFEDKIKTANYELRKAIKLFADKERKYQNLRNKFEILFNEKEKLTEDVRTLRTQNAEILLSTKSNAKLSKLKSYIKKINSQNVVKS